MSIPNKGAGSVRKLGPHRFMATLVLGEGRGASKKTKTLKTLSEANAWLATVKHDGVANGPTAKMTLGEMFDIYIAENLLAPNTALSYLQAKKHAVSAGITERRLDRLDPTVQTVFTKALARHGLAPSTINLHAQKLNAVLRYAAAKRAINFTPHAVTVVRDKVDVPAITPCDVRALIEAAPDEFAPAIILQAFAGLRASEAAAVTVGDVDWFAGTLTVSKAMDTRAMFVKTKTSKSRTVPLAPEVVEQLSVYAVGKAHDDMLATNLNGGALATATYQRLFSATATDAGVSVTSHALRKFYATTMLASGVNPKAVAKYLGDTVETMLKTYALVQQTDADLARVAGSRSFARMFNASESDVATSASRARGGATPGGPSTPAAPV